MKCLRQQEYKYGSNIFSKELQGERFTMKNSIRFMTYNIQHGHIHLSKQSGDEIDLTKVGSVIRNASADIIGLNEVRGNGADGYTARASAYTAQAEFLANYLGFHCYFGRSCYIGRSNPYGNAILSRYPIIEARVIPIPDLADPRDMRNYEPRSITRCVIEIPADENSKLNIAVYISHFGLHEREAEVAVSTIKGILKDEELPFVLMGDFNLTPESTFMEYFYNELTPTDELMPENERCTFPSDAPDSKIDYIFTSTDVKPVSANVIRAIASDHCPIVADIEFSH